MGNFYSNLDNPQRIVQLIPSLKNAKNVTTLQEYPQCTLNQISEGFEYYMANESHLRRNTLSMREFEEYFGQLFCDPGIHYLELENSAAHGCVVMDAFMVFVLLSDAEMKNKIKYLIEIFTIVANSKESSTSSGAGASSGNKSELRDFNKMIIRMELIQMIFVKALYSLEMIFQIQIPSKDDIYLFVDESIKFFVNRSSLSVEQQQLKLRQTIEANHINNQNNTNSGTTTTEQSTNNTFDTNEVSNTTTSIRILTEKSLLFQDIWEWCQDVHIISRFLDSLQTICSKITSKLDRSHKGQRWILRNSFFAQSFMQSYHHYHAENTASGGNTIGGGGGHRWSIFRNTPRNQKNPSFMRGSKQLTIDTSNNTNSALENILSSINQHLSFDIRDLVRVENRSPLWKYQVKHLLHSSNITNINTTTSTYNSTGGQAVVLDSNNTACSAAFEHLILSQQSAVVLVRKQLITNNNTHYQQNTTSHGSVLSNMINTNNTTTSSSQKSMKSSNKPHQSSLHQDTSTASSAINSNVSFNSDTFCSHLNINATTTTASSVPLTNKFNINTNTNTSGNYYRWEVDGVLSHSHMISWMISNLPTSIIQDILMEEEEQKQRRASFEFSLSKHKNTNTLLLNKQQPNAATTGEYIDVVSDLTGGRKDTDEHSDQDDGQVTSSVPFSNTYINQSKKHSILQQKGKKDSHVGASSINFNTSFADLNDHDSHNDHEQHDEDDDNDHDDEDGHDNDESTPVDNINNNTNTNTITTPLSLTIETTTNVDSTPINTLLSPRTLHQRQQRLRRQSIDFMWQSTGHKIFHSIVSTMPSNLVYLNILNIPILSIGSNTTTTTTNIPSTISNNTSSSTTSNNNNNTNTHTNISNITTNTLGNNFYHKLYDLQHVVTSEQSLYNVIHAYAQGYRHILYSPQHYPYTSSTNTTNIFTPNNTYTSSKPPTNTNNNNQNSQQKSLNQFISQVISISDIAGFLLDHFHEFFPQFITTATGPTTATGTSTSTTNTPFHNNTSRKQHPFVNKSNILVMPIIQTPFVKPVPHTFKSNDKVVYIYLKMLKYHLDHVVILDDTIVAGGTVPSFNTTGVDSTTGENTINQDALGQALPSQGKILGTLTLSSVSTLWWKWMRQVMAIYQKKLEKQRQEAASSSTSTSTNNADLPSTVLPFPLYSSLVEMVMDYQEGRYDVPYNMDSWFIDKQPTNTTTSNNNPSGLFSPNKQQLSTTSKHFNFINVPSSIQTNNNTNTNNNLIGIKSIDIASTFYFFEFLAHPLIDVSEKLFNKKYIPFDIYINNKLPTQNSNNTTNNPSRPPGSAGNPFQQRATIRNHQHLFATMTNTNTSTDIVYNSLAYIPYSAYVGVNAYYWNVMQELLTSLRKQVGSHVHTSTLDSGTMTPAIPTTTVSELPSINAAVHKAKTQLSIDTSFATANNNNNNNTNTINTMNDGGISSNTPSRKNSRKNLTIINATTNTNNAHIVQRAYSDTIKGPDHLLASSYQDISGLQYDCVLNTSNANTAIASNNTAGGRNSLKIKVNGLPGSNTNTVFTPSITTVDQLIHQPRDVYMLQTLSTTIKALVHQHIYTLLTTNTDSNTKQGTMIIPRFSNASSNNNNNNNTSNTSTGAVTMNKMSQLRRGSSIKVTMMDNTNNNTSVYGPVTAPARSSKYQSELPSFTPAKPTENNSSSSSMTSPATTNNIRKRLSYATDTEKSTIPVINNNNNQQDTVTIPTVTFTPAPPPPYTSPTHERKQSTNITNTENTVEAALNHANLLTPRRPSSYITSSTGNGRNTGNTMRQSIFGLSAAAREKQLKDQQKQLIASKRRLESWYTEHRLLSPQDTLQSALHMIQREQVDTVYIASNNGELLGMISLQDICQFLIVQEAREKITKQGDVISQDNMHGNNNNNTNNNASTMNATNAFNATMNHSPSPPRIRNSLINSGIKSQRSSMVGTM